MISCVFGIIPTFQEDGIGGSCRRLEQYSESMLKWMCAVGTTPSAGGARAPIADILSHLGTEVKRLMKDRIIVNRLVSWGCFLSSH